MDDEYQILALLQWKNPKRSGGVFYCLNIVFYLIECAELSFLSIVSFCLATFLTLYFVHSSVHASSIHSKEMLSKESLEKQVSALYQVLNNLIRILKNKGNFWYIISALLVASYTSNLMSSTKFLWLLSLILFSVPSFYQKHKEAVDQVLLRNIENIWSFFVRLEKCIPRAKSKTE